MSRCCLLDSIFVGWKLNVSYIILQHMLSTLVIASWSLPFGSIITSILKHFRVSISEPSHNKPKELRDKAIASLGFALSMSMIGTSWANLYRLLPPIIVCLTMCFSLTSFLTWVLLYDHKLYPFIWCSIVIFNRSSGFDAAAVDWSTFYIHTTKWTSVLVRDISGLFPFWAVASICTEASYSKWPATNLLYSQDSSTILIFISAS